MVGNFPLKVFFDSDVVIAGSALQTSASFLLLQLAEVKLIKGYISVQVKNECIRDIKDKLSEALPFFREITNRCFGNPVKLLPDFLESVQGQAHSKDVPILAGAVQVEAKYLVTFNTKHYYPEKKLNITVVSPSELLQIIRKSLSI